jgi:hypothetical protein
MKEITKLDQIKKVYTKHLLGEVFPVRIYCPANDGEYVKVNETVTEDHIKVLVENFDHWSFDYNVQGVYPNTICSIYRNIARDLANQISPKLLIL